VDGFLFGGILLFLFDGEKIDTARRWNFSGTFLIF